MFPLRGLTFRDDGPQLENPDAMPVPLDDIQRLSALPREDFIVWTRDRAREYQRYTSVLLTLHNAALPIHRLPIELLSTIFVLSCGSSSSVRLTQVCQLWRSVLSSTPRFWADLVGITQFASTRPLSALPFLLSMCSTLPVRLNLSFKPTISPILHLHRSQITSLRIDVDGSDTFISLHHFVAQNGMPTLQHLSIVFASDYKPPRSVPDGPWSDDRLPCLHELEAPPSCLPFVAVTSLRTILLGTRSTFWRINATPRVSDKIAQCTKLQILRLVNVSWPDANETFPVVPSLGLLVICNVQHRQRALPPLHALSGHKIPAKILLQVEDVHLTLPTILARILGINPIYANVFRSVMFDFACHTVDRKDAMCFRASDHHTNLPVVTVMASWMKLEEAVSASLEQLGALSLERLVVRQHSMQPQRNTALDWNRVLRTFSGLTTLHVNHFPPLILDLLAALAGHDPSTDIPPSGGASDSEATAPGRLASLCIRLRELQLFWRLEQGEDRWDHVDEDTKEARGSQASVRTHADAQSFLGRRSRLVNVILPVLRIRAAQGSRLKYLKFAEFTVEKSSQGRTEGERGTQTVTLKPLRVSTGNWKSERRDYEELEQLVDNGVRYYGLFVHRLSTSV